MKLLPFLGIGQSGDLPTFERGLVAFAHGLEFGLINAVVVVDAPGKPELWIDVGNTPHAYTEISKDPQVCKRNPVMRRLKRTSVPFSYDQDLYLREGAIDIWDHQAAHGYATGLAVALHLPGHTHFLVGMDRHEALPDDVDELTSLMASLHLFAAHALDAAMNLHEVEGVAHERALAESSGVELTRRERECLQWAAEGKTAWETGRILSIAEGSVAKLALTATRKLGCVNKAHALVKALRLGIIQ